MDVLQGILGDMLRVALQPGTAGVALAVIGLNIHFGFTGLLNMGQAGFMLLGAYGMAISIKEGLPLVVAVLLGLLAAVAFALVLGIPTLKLRGDYLAIVTISAAEIIRYAGRLADLEDFTGAAQGIPVSRYMDPIRNLSFLPDGRWKVPGLPLDYSTNGVDSWWLRIVAWSLVALGVLIVWLLVRSPWGRLLRGIREDEDAIRSLGKNVFAVKMQALVLGGVFGAAGGMVYVMTQTVQPDSMGRQLTFFCWTALLLGGAATVFGPVLGSILFYALRLFIQASAGHLLPDGWMNSTQQASFQWIIVGVALMLLVIFRPQGILGNKRELQFNG